MLDGVLKKDEHRSTMKEFSRSLVRYSTPKLLWIDFVGLLINTSQDYELAVESQSVTMKKRKNELLQSVLARF
jgi:hypothetical protein